jgi:hypothetical protein
MPAQILNPQNIKYIGKCIYCGIEDDLTDEHIVPYGLGGRWKLIKASCPSCSKITSAFEREVLREYFILVRTKLNLPTYHPKNRRKSFNFKISKGGIEGSIDIPASDCPTLFIMPSFEKPGHIATRPQSSALILTGTSLHGSDLQEFRIKYNLESVSYTLTYTNSFARLLAKIAYGMVIDQHGISSIDEAYVLPSILGIKDDIGNWVGCENNTKSLASGPKEQFLHRVDVLRNNNNEVGARIRLFANFNTPEYLVIVGHLK